jgi:hypothetical protein
MRPLILLVCTAAAMALNANAQVPKHIGQYEASAKDTEAITQVTKDFRDALKSGDAKKLSSLLLSSRILFTTPMSPERVRKTRDEEDIHAIGISEAGASEFLKFVATSKKPIEERFYNIKITQDRQLAWVMFDFEFLLDGKIENYGIETWQMLKTTDESWKILSVVWSSHGAPK